MQINVEKAYFYDYDVPKFSVGCLRKLATLPIKDVCNCIGVLGIVWERLDISVFIKVLSLQYPFKIICTVHKI